MPFRQVLSREPAYDIAHVVGKHRRALVGEGVQRKSRTAIRTGRAAKPEIDPSRGDRIEHAELLCDFQGRIVGQHHTGASDPDAVCRLPDRGDQDFRCRADNCFIAVMLGNPEALVTEPLAMLCQSDCVADRVAVRTANTGNRLVQHREFSPRYCSF